MNPEPIYEHLEEPEETGIPIEWAIEPESLEPLSERLSQDIYVIPLEE